MSFKMQLLLMLAYMLIGSCTKWMKFEENNNESNNITPSTDQSLILDVHAEVKNTSVKISISNIPEGAALACELDYIKQEKCEADMSLENLSDGEYLLHVLAIKNATTVAVGESFFRIGQKSPDVPILAQKSELEMTIDSKFVSGEARKTSDDLQINFKPSAKLNCAASFECSHGDREVSYWKNCAEKTSHTIKKGFLAKGLQYFHVRAKCDNKIGPIANYYFYGVDDRYYKNGKPVPLTLDYTLDRQEKKYIFRLMKANDCEESKSAFECSTDSVEFTECDRVQVAPPDTFMIRAVCENVKGPIVETKEINAH